jgi:NADH-quinone oxidoreductase subunit L
VMHAMNDQVDMRRFGGLWKVMPITWATFGVGYLAIIGFPGFSGFFTKDKIIEAAYDKGGASGWILGTCALVGAGITAFYMTRLFIGTFHGRRRWTDDVHPHESPPVMTVPMVILALGSIAAGGLLVLGGALQNWLIPSAGEPEEVGVHTIEPTIITALTLLVVLGGALGGWLAFGRRPMPVRRPRNVSPVTVAARRDLYGNAFNEAVFMRPGMWLDRFLVWLDNRGVDGAVNGVAAAFGGGSGRLRRTQTGFVRSYALSMLGGSVLIVASLLAVRFV